MEVISHYICSSMLRAKSHILLQHESGACRYIKSEYNCKFVNGHFKETSYYKISAIALGPGREMTEARLETWRECIEKSRAKTEHLQTTVDIDPVLPFSRVLHTKCCHIRARACVLSVTMVRSSEDQGSSRSRQQRRWASVCVSPQSQLT